MGHQIFKIKPCLTLTAYFNLRRKPSVRGVLVLVGEALLALCQFVILALPLMAVLIIISPILIFLLVTMLLTDDGSMDDHERRMSAGDYEAQIKDKQEYLMARLGFVPDCPMQIGATEIAEHLRVRKLVEAGKLVPVDEAVIRTPWGSMVTTEIRPALLSWMEGERIALNDPCLHRKFAPPEFDFAEPLASDRCQPCLLHILTHRSSTPEFRAYLLLDFSRTSALREKLEEDMLAGRYALHDILAATQTPEEEP